MSTPSPLADRIRAQLSRYLAGDISLRAFDEWFVLETIDVEQTGDADAIALAGQIFGRLAEYSRGDRTAAELRVDFRRLARAGSSVRSRVAVPSSS